MTMKFVYVILIFISSVSTESETLNNINKEFSDININNHVDRFIPQISQFMVNRGLDPLNLPQIDKKLWVKLPSTAVSKQVEPMIYRADLVLHSGILKKLSDLERYGNATMNDKDEIIRLDIGLDFKLLEGSYNFIIKLVFFNLEGRVLISAAVRAKSNVTFNRANKILSLDNLDLQVPNNIKVRIEKENGQVKPISTFIANIITRIFKDTIVNFVQDKVANIIQTYFDELNNSINKNKVFENYIKLVLHENQMLI